MGVRRITNVVGGPAGCTVLDEDSHQYEYGSLVVEKDGTVRFESAEERAKKRPAPEGSRTEGEEVGTPEADPTG